jgi:PAS domain S-box-containing protein
MKDKANEEFIKNMGILQKRIVELEKFRILFESSRDAIMTIEPPSWKFASCNPATVRLFGARNEAELISKEPWMLSPEFQPDGARSFDKAKEMIDKAMDEGSVFFAWAHKRLDGDIFFANVLLTRAEVEKGRPFVQATVRDVTEHKKVEDELKWKTELLEAQKEAMIDGLLVVDENGKRILTNKRLLELWHVPQHIADDSNDEVLLQYVVGRTKDPKSFLDKVNYLYAHKNETSKDEVEFKDGMIFERYSSPVIDKNGRYFGRIWTFRDITERRKAETELEVALERRQDINILQQQLLAPDSLQNKLKVITDSIVRIFNADFCRIWLIYPGDLCEKGCVHAKINEGPHVCRFRNKCLHLMSSSGRYTHIDGRDHKRVPFGCYKIGRVASGEDHRFLTNDVVNDPRVHNHEWARELGLISFAGYQLKIPNGETIGVMALFAKHKITPTEDVALDSIGVATAFVVQQAAMKDEVANAYAGLEDKVRERTKELSDAQDRIVRFEKMAAVGQLASSVAHELRNPLGVMKNAVYYLNMLGLGKDNSDIGENLKIISDEVENSDKIISDLLEFSHIKQPALRLEDINSIVKETLARIKVPANIKVITELGKDLVRIKVDALQAQQVFYNLTQNAIQAMEKGGTLTISSCVTNDENTTITFKDTGCGIPNENMKKIFEPLFSTKIKGTGLGLSVVSSLVEGHGGKLEVASEVGRGTIFTVKLPMR